MTSKPGFPHVVVFVVFAAFFFILFSQFPLAGRLPGNCDNWYAIAFTNIYLNQLGELLGAGSHGSFFYPVENPLAYGETSFALALLPMVVRGVGIGDVWAYYVFISIVYATTAFATYLVATLYVGRRTLAAVAGLAFAASNFLLSTIDSPHTTFFAIAFLSVYYFKRYILYGRNRDLWYSMLLAGIQTYFGAYVFVFMAMVLVILGLANLRELLARQAGFRRLVVYAGVVVVMSSPFYASYFLKLTDYFSWRSQAVLFAEFNSLDLQDLFNPMPDNLLYPEGHRFDHSDAIALQRRLGRSDPSFETPEFLLMIGASPRQDEESLWVSSRKRAFIGAALYLLALVGAWRTFPGRRELLALIVVGFILALGPVNVFGDRVVPMPLYVLYEYLPGFHMFRIPGRAFALMLLAVVVCAAKGLELLLERYAPTSHRVPLVVALLVGALVVVENVPFPMRSFEAAAYARPPRDYLRFFSDKHDAVVLNLPSGIGYGLAGSADDLNVFNRELIYINWQTYLGLDIVNGVNGYIPHTRITTQKFIAGLPREDAIAGLARIGVDFIVFNKGLLLPGESVLAHGLERAGSLEPVHDSETTAIFKVRR